MTSPIIMHSSEYLLQNAIINYMKFVFFHGSFVGPEYIWWPFLKRELEKLNQTVIAPQYPVDFWNEAQHVTDYGLLRKQTLEHWTEKYSQIVTQFDPSDKLCFVGHSLGPLFILHMLERFPIKLDSAIFVAPFFTKLNTSPIINHVNESFYRNDFDFKKLNSLIPKSYTLLSNDDPHVDNELSLDFANKLKSDVVQVSGLAHFATSIKMTKFPLLLELCKTRLSGSTYLAELQK